MSSRWLPVSGRATPSDFGRYTSGVNTMTEFYECDDCKSQFEVTEISFDDVEVKDVETGKAQNYPVDTLICFKCEEKSRNTHTSRLRRLVEV